MQTTRPHDTDPSWRPGCLYSTDRICLMLYFLVDNNGFTLTQIIENISRFTWFHIDTT